MELVVFDLNGKETGRTVVLRDDIFGLEPNNHAIYLDVKQFLANQRQGTHKAKQRGEISGSTRKLKKQKGTGGARCGSIKSPIFVGGGRVFGPVPRDYSFKLNKKLKRVARKGALSYKAKANSITVVEPIVMEQPRTKAFIELTNNLQLTGKKMLFVVPSGNSNLYLSSRNIQKVKVTDASSINTYDVMNAAHLVISEDAVELINQMFGL